jgi:choline dehydrogenase-like flavoprotein
MTMKEQVRYDAIVVGSGITGGWAAKELCEKGLKVLLLERGRNIEHPNYPTATKDPWEFPHRSRLTEEDRKTHYVQARHYSFREDNKHFYINDLQNPYDETQRFDWVRGDTVGGRSLLWARACYRWSDFDFEANLKDGVGVDWPIRYKDIAPWYDYVERFIGVSGSAENIPQLPDGIFQPPFEMNEVEKFYKAKIEKAYPERKVIMGRTANLTRPVKGRGHCMARDLCDRGCPYGAYFSTNASTFPAAYSTGNLTVRPHSLVNKVIYDKQRATGVEIIDTQTHQTTVFDARIIFLNAATVATSFILLNSASSRFPNGLGNGSDQVGRNLMDHHKGLSASARVDGFEESYYYGRRPTSLYIPRFKNLDKKEPAFLRAYQFGASASRGRGGGEHEIGAVFKDSLTEPSGWSFGLWGFGECLPYADNRIILNHNKLDPWSRPTITVDCEFKENEKAMHKDMGETAHEMLENLGLKDISISNTISFPGNANHEMGTARMGRDLKTSVLNSFNQMHEVKNVFITDGSCMTSSSCVNPSLTYMALTARACDYAVKEMKKLNI